MTSAKKLEKFARQEGFTPPALIPSEETGLLRGLERRDWVGGLPEEVRLTLHRAKAGEWYELRNLLLAQAQALQPPLTEEEKRVVY